MSWTPLNRLTLLANQLARHSETEGTAQHIRNEEGKLCHYWREDRKISIRNMPMPTPRDQGLFPTGCKIDHCRINLDFGHAENGSILRAAFQLQVKGLLDYDQSIIELEDHWRIDTNENYLSVEEQTHEGREPHPSFHFQRGGHAQEEFAAKEGFVPSANTGLGAGEWRALMQYPGPRIPSLPFDSILAIDFCLAQNDGLLWRRIHRSSPEYRNLVAASQREIWHPFFESLCVCSGRRAWLGTLAIK